jgi:hypothetical protein
MERLSFDIFEPEKKRFHITPNLIVVSMWAFVILVLWALDGVVPVGSTLRNALLVVVVIITIAFLIRSFVTYAPLKGAMDGKIIFNDDGVEVKGVQYKFSRIGNIDFRFIDFYGEMGLGFKGNFDSLLSQGVSNYISFDDKLGETKQVYFRMMTKNSSSSLYPFINAAVKSGAMSYYRAIDLIDVENVTKP